MPTDMVRKHFLMPRKVAEEFERAVGERKQSEHVTRLVENWLASQRLLDVAERLGGFAATEHPEWESSDGISNWLSELRRGWDRELTHTSETPAS